MDPRWTYSITTHAALNNENTNLPRATSPVPGPICRRELARSHTTKPPRFHRASTRKASSLHRDEISQPRLALKATGEHPRLGPTFPLPRSAVVGPNGRRRAAVRRGPDHLALLHEHAVVRAPIFEIITGLDKTIFLGG